MPKDIRGWSLREGDTVAYAIKPGKLVLGTVLPLNVQVGSAFEETARELYVRLEGPTGKVLRGCHQVSKCTGEAGNG